MYKIFLFKVALVHFIIGVATIAGASWIIDAFVYGDQIYSEKEIGIGADIFGFPLTRDTNGELKPSSLDKPKTAMVCFPFSSFIRVMPDKAKMGYPCMKGMFKCS